MAVRIHFGMDDLARTYIAERPDPLWEVLLSLHLLHHRNVAPAFASWRQRTLSQLGGPVRGLLTLAPPRGYSPDFLTPDTSAVGLEEGLESLAATPRARLRTDLERFTYGHRQVPLWVPELTTKHLAGLADAVRAYYTTAIDPYETQIRSHIEADRSTRTCALQGGVERLLGTLHPELCWQSPVLELRTGSAERDVHLGGRGLRLIPSFFCWRSPIMLRDPELPPVLVYPIQHSPGWEADCRRRVRADAKSPCAALLGHTRAAALEVVATGCTTSELARRLNVSPATATHHTAILRAAGLISSYRTGGSIRHTLRSLGEALLRG